MDDTLKGLLRKEWEMMKGFLIGKYLIAILLLFLLGSEVSIYNGLSSLMVAGLIIIPASVLFSLNTESNQMQAFLHNPQSAHKLLLAKLIYSAFIAAVFMVILTLSITGMELLWDVSYLSIFEVFSYVVYISFLTLVISLYPLAIILFVWTLHQIWRTYLGAGISIIFIVIMMIVAGNIFEVFRQSLLYEKLTQWGSVSFPINQDQLVDIELGFLGHFHLGFYLFYGLIAIILYFISAYLLDRKVEV